MPNAEAWQSALSELGAQLVLPKDFSTRDFAGHLPVNFKGRRSGFEYFFGPVDQGWTESPTQLGNRDRVVTLVPRDERELNAAMWAAAGLLRCSDGVFYDPQGDTFADLDGVLRLAREEGVPDVPIDDTANVGEDGPRQRRRGDAFDQTLDATIKPVLEAEGFAEMLPYLFARNDAGGRDLICFTVYEEEFSVALGYLPHYMEEVNRLFDPSPVGIAPGGLRQLAPTAISRADAGKSYRFNSPRKMEQSFRLVHQGLSGVAFRWLATLRDPSVYAAELPGIHPIWTARALEAAGKIDAAREHYRKELARDSEFRRAVPQSPGEVAMSFAARLMVYVALNFRLSRTCARNSCGWVASN